MYSDRFVDVFGEPRRPGAPLMEKHQEVAASLQAMLEEAEFALVRRLQRETKQSALCMAGGVALNSAFNGKVLPETPFTDIYIQPAANDAFPTGIAAGRGIVPSKRITGLSTIRVVPCSITVRT